MKIIILSGGRRKHREEAKQLTLLRDYPIGPPLWMRILVLIGLCVLWTWLFFPRGLI